jgi:hypothetical protein
VVEKQMRLNRDHPTTLLPLFHAWNRNWAGLPESAQAAILASSNDPRCRMHSTS